MRRAFSVLGSAFFLVLAPGTVSGLVPWWISGWKMEASPPGWLPVRVLGALLVLGGLPVLLDSFGRFALVGLGTPAPVFPTRHLVVGGLYRYVRNPMYVSVVAIILGQGLFLPSARVFAYGVVVFLGFHLFVIGYEEPTLRRTFGEEYDTFCRHVSRWIPRLHPWIHPGPGAGEGPESPPPPFFDSGGG